MPALISRDSFIGLGSVAHLAAGGEAPVLRSHVEAATRFFCDKGDGMPGRTRMFEVVARAKTRLADLLGGRSGDVALLSSASAGLAVAAAGIEWRSGDNVVVARCEFPSVLHVWQALERRGVQVRAVGSGPVVSAGELRGAADGRTRAIAASHVSYLTGLRHDLGQLREIADRVGARLVVDVSHSLGVVPVDASLCDAVVSCAYKWLLAVHGVGVFYVNSARWPDLAPPSVGWHSVVEPHDWRARSPYVLKADAERFEGGNPTFIGIYVLENALAATAAIERRAVENHVSELGTLLRDGLTAMDLEVLTPSAPAERAGNFAFASSAADEIEARLRAEGVVVWAGDGRVRISVHLYNDEGDVRRCLRALGPRG